MGTKGLVEVKMTVIPDCQFCSMIPGMEVSKAEYDGATQVGPWAYMCSYHFKQYGVGIGTGKGQYLNLGKDSKGVETMTTKVANPKETTINFNDMSDMAVVYTEDRAIMGGLKNLGYTEDTERKSKHGNWFLVPRTEVRFGPVQIQMTKSGRVKKVKRPSNLTDEQRKAIGVRLQTARAVKLGLTYDQFRAMKLRPGAVPTPEQMADVNGSKPKAKRSARPVKK